MLIFSCERPCELIGEYQRFRGAYCLHVQNAHRGTKPLKLWQYLFQAMHQLQQRNTAARIHCHWFCRFVREGVHVEEVRLRLKRNTLYMF
jgi:hypothetical protein